ncbi:MULTISPECIES: hypothetical protein [unclassified Streptomyces]|uniref:hypothetical protein n=1 Tax=unclassified Streptomyces TaxID=2593676 RepID=UPI002E181447|nr:MULTISPECIES: hypothetical protein [unclassified Streptomyces]
MRDPTRPSATTTPASRPLLERLAKVADTAALLVLRRRLNEALHRPGACPPR